MRHFLRLRTVLGAALLAAAALGAGAGSAHPGPCYTVGIDDGDPDHPSATVCPWD